MMGNIEYSHFFVQLIPNKYDCPICGRKGIYKDKYRRELCMKCKMIAKRTGRYIANGNR